MKPPLERAARALCELAGNFPMVTTVGKPLGMSYLAEARAVLHAIREPSQSMVGEGRTILQEGGRTILQEGERKTVEAYKAKIVAALDETT